MRNVWVVCLLLLSIALWAGKAVAQSSLTFDLHAAYALTGIGASFGNAEVNGTTLAIEEFNRSGDLDGRKVRLVVEDTQSSNVQTLNAIRKLTSLNHAKVILGPTWLDSYQSVLPLADREKLLLFTPSAAVVVFKNSPDQHMYAFSTWFNLEIEVELLLKKIKLDHREKILLAFDQDPFFQTVRNLIRSKAAALGLVILSDESFEPQLSDFKSTLLKTRNKGADCALFGFGDENNLITFLKQRALLNKTLPLYGTDYLDGYVSQSQWSHLFENVSFISSVAREKGFSEVYKKRFGVAPVLSASTAYDAARILLQALTADQRTPEAIREFLLTGEFNTVTFGKVRFNALGGVQSSDFVIKKVSQGVLREEPVS